MKLLNAAARLAFVSSALVAERTASAALGVVAGPGSEFKASRGLLDAHLLDSISESAAAELGEVVEVLHNAGDELSRDGVRVVAGWLRGEETARARLARGLRETLALGRPDAAGDRARLEARAKFDVFWQVRRARDAHGADRDGRLFDLENALGNALAYDSKYAFWALEGLGHDYVKAHLESGLDAPRQLLRHPCFQGLDAGQLAALHAGLGLAAAESIAGGLDRHSKAGRVERSVASFERFCRDNAASGSQAEVALEALGLVVSVFFVRRRPAIEHALATFPRLRRLYWHGAGRGAYFSGSQLIPGYGSLARAISKIFHLAPEARDCRDALAGLGYALTMVNFETPDVLAGGLTALKDRIEAEEDLRLGLGLGIAGALAMQRLLGRGEQATALLELTAGKMPASLWRSMIQGPDALLAAEGRANSLYGSLPWGAGQAWQPPTGTDPRASRS